MNKQYKVIFLAVLIYILLGIIPSQAFSEEINTTDINPLMTAPPISRYVPDEILVKFKPGYSSASIESLNRRLGTELIERLKRTGICKLRITGGESPEEMIERYRSIPEAEYVGVNRYYYALETIPNDPFYFPYQWHFPQIKLPYAWDMATGSEEIKVAVIDTGIDLTHPDLEDNILKDESGAVVGWDYVNNDDDPSDDLGHGTHIAGLIAAVTNNDLGVAGVTWRCKLIPYKVLDDKGVGEGAHVAEAIAEAVSEEARIINLSLGDVEPDEVIKQELEKAYSKGVLIVAAAGNSGLDQVHYPAAYPSAIAVGATDARGKRTYYSSYGNSLELMAPGGDVSRDDNGDKFGDGITSTTPLETGSYYNATYQGTSMSSPHVAGVAALLFSLDPSLTNEEVRAILRGTTDNIGDPYECGYGLVNAYKALASIYPSPPPPPPPDPKPKSKKGCGLGWEILFAYAGMSALGVKNLFRSLTRSRENL